MMKDNFRRLTRAIEVIDKMNAVNKIVKEHDFNKGGSILLKFNDGLGVIEEEPTEETGIKIGLVKGKVVDLGISIDDLPDKDALLKEMMGVEDSIKEDMDKGVDKLVDELFNIVTDRCDCAVCKARREVEESVVNGTSDDLKNKAKVARFFVDAIINSRNNKKN